VQQFDLIVIGSGPAGEKGAVQAAYFGKRVALIEHEVCLGGACVNTGTIPSKILRESALYFSGIAQRGLYGLDYSLKEGLTVKNFMHRKDVIVEAQRQKVLQNLVAHGVDLMRGVASFEDANTVSVQKSGEREHPRLRRADCNRFRAASRARNSIRR
jgi:NAD(P) transhydrogenase